MGDNAHYCLTHYRQWRAMNPGEPDYLLKEWLASSLPIRTINVEELLRHDRRLAAVQSDEYYSRWRQEEYLRQKKESIKELSTFVKPDN